jgi:hypothetical protein
VIVVWVGYFEKLVDKIEPLFKTDAVNNRESWRFAPQLRPGRGSGKSPLVLSNKIFPNGNILLEVNLERKSQIPRRSGSSRQEKKKDGLTLADAVTTSTGSADHLRFQGHLNSPSKRLAL